MADDLEILLIEDNAGDARLIEEMLRDVDELLRRVDVEGPTREGSTVHHEQRLDDGLERLTGGDAGVDVVLLDLGLPDSTGLETLAAVVDATEFVPVVVLTGLRDEEMGIQAIQRGAQDYLVKDEVTSDMLVRSIHHALERNRQERARARQLEQLASLNRLNRISQEVTHAVITTEAREDLEQAVCGRFVDAEEYPFAWIGEVDRATGRITSRVDAGEGDGYLEETTITAESDETGMGPAGRAVRTREVQVVSDTQSDPAFEPWREAADARGYRSGASVPITYESVRYGVLCLYAASPNAFSEPEIQILSRLGDVVGHAITSIERKDALVSDTVRELEFILTDRWEELVALTAGDDATISVEKLLDADEHLVAYGRTDGISGTALTDAAAPADDLSDVRVLDTTSTGVEFELTTAVGRSLVEAVATRGGVVESAAVVDGECRFVCRFPSGRDVRQLVELVQEHCPTAVPHAQRTVTPHEPDTTALPSVLEDQLTDKQRGALEAAYFAGYFDWPRTSSSEEVADRLGVTPATFTHHLRAAERTFFDEVFAAAEPVDRTDWSAWTAPESEQASR